MPLLFKTDANRMHRMSFDFGFVNIYFCDSVVFTSLVVLFVKEIEHLSVHSSSCFAFLLLKFDAYIKAPFFRSKAWFPFVTVGDASPR